MGSTTERASGEVERELVLGRDDAQEVRRVVVLAAANVRPASSSITWTVRCLLERNTARRGRAAVPWIFLRTRR